MIKFKLSAKLVLNGLPLLLLTLIPATLTPTSSSAVLTTPANIPRTTENSDLRTTTSTIITKTTVKTTSAVIPKTTVKPTSTVTTKTTVKTTSAVTIKITVKASIISTAKSTNSPTSSGKPNNKTTIKTFVNITQTLNSSIDFLDLNNTFIISNMSSQGIKLKPHNIQVNKQCPSYFCRSNPKYFHPNGTLNLLNSVGMVTTSCNKQYMFSTTERNLKEAQEFCCNLKMTLLSIETNEQLQCVLDASKGLGPTKGTMYWSSGSRQGGAGGNFTWCGSGVPFASDVTWAPGEPNNVAKMEQCVVTTLNMGTPFALMDKNCIFPYHFICEGPTIIPFDKFANTNNVTNIVLSAKPPSKFVSPECIPHRCRVNPTMFDINGSLTVPPSFGAVKTSCNTLYMFGKQMANVRDALMTCCDLNMRLVSAETAEKTECLLNAYKGLKSSQDDRFWTSGRRGGGSANFTWCGSGLQLGQEAGWAPGEPNGSAARAQCTNLLLTAGRALLEDNECHQKMLYVCEGSLTTPSPTTLTSPRAPTMSKKVFTSQQCPSYPCVTDPKLFSASGSLDVPSDVGIVKKGCDSWLMFSKEKRSFRDSLSACCRADMRLVALEDRDKTACLAALTADTKLSNALYWTSGSSQINRESVTQSMKINATNSPQTLGANCSQVISSHPTKCGTGGNSMPKGGHLFSPGVNVGQHQGRGTSFTWCSSGSPFGTNLTWAKSEPNNLGNNESCVNIALTSPSQGLLMDSNCEAKMLYICELPVTTTPAPRRQCPKHKCQANANVLDKNKAASSFKNAGLVRSNCGNRYLFGTTRKSFKEAQESCCSLNMRLVSIQTEDQMTCLEDAFALDVKTPPAIEWYWTSGSNQNTAGNLTEFVWCSTGTKVGADAVWDLDEPNFAGRAESCVILILTPPNRGYLVDKSCALPFYYICEREPA